jgi:hypothetical protein
MKLTDDQVEECARLLAANCHIEWEEPKAEGIRQIVRNLAAELNVENSPGAYAVFRAWMGDREAVGI